MKRYQDEDDDDEWDDENAGSGDDADEEPTVPCPHCRRQILEDVPRCPYCERYISEEDFAAPRKPLWVTLTALICLGFATWWLFTAFGFLIP